MLVIEFCDGGSLLDRLRNAKKPVLLVTKLLSYALQSLIALFLKFFKLLVFSSKWNDLFGES